ncbi:AraC family transcriptional regulator [Cryobacterium melibiosiphilum]|uniref:AraC family transcriptional regulator n=1 Tax=Cryobacterium melibiosiphilum TaxID=995039 RepID=A0A3A5MKI4_9MICO|nr:GyrI-like domain-containing protein [Cryobacterium melibiosiphilum]RJT90620.1 AraC family transcriptional regulator [Cryobacterium melibiosiphilum]
MNCERVTLAPKHIFGYRALVPLAELSEFFRPTFDAVAREMEDHGVEIMGPPTAVYHAMAHDTVEVTAGFPVAALATPRAASVIEALPGGPAVVAVHTGGYDTIRKTHQLLSVWVEKQHLALAAVTWEEYLVGPAENPDPAAWQTRLVYPLA